MRYTLIALLLLSLLASPAAANNPRNSWKIQGEITALINTTELVAVCVGIKSQQDFCFAIAGAPPFWDHTGNTWRYYKNFVQIGDCVYAAGDHVPNKEFFSGENNRAIEAFHKMHPAYCQ